jgi:hypothetical protein
MTTTLGANNIAKDMYDKTQGVPMPTESLNEAILKQEDKQKPWEFPHVHLVMGEQKSGKNATVVARVRDYVYCDCVKVYLKEQKGIDSSVLTPYDDMNSVRGIIVLSYDKKARIAKLKAGKFIKYIRIPKSYKLHSNIRIYSVFHIKNIPCKFAYCTWVQIIRGLKNDIIKDAFLLLDQYEIVGSARDGQSKVGKYFYKITNQLAKRHLETYIIAPTNRHADWTIRDMATETITCRHIDGTDLTNIIYKRRGQTGHNELEFHASEYYVNYDADELVPVPSQDDIKELGI